MNDLKVFENKEFGSIRTVQIDNEPYFVGKDVAEILGYSNTKDAIATHVDAEDRTVIQRSENATLEIPNRGLTVINESGLYSLILSSKLPTAKKFKRWVTAEVLPSIRQTGTYMTAETIEKVLYNPDMIIGIAQQLKALQLENAQKTQLIGELRPKANYVDMILNNKGLVTITQIAKDYGMSGKRMNSLLNSLGVQYKQSGQWLLYSKYHDLGYTHSKTIDIKRSDGRPDVVMETKWTQKGRLFIYDLLKDNGIYPVIEQAKAS